MNDTGVLDGLDLPDGTVVTVLTRDDEPAMATVSSKAKMTKTVAYDVSAQLRTPEEMAAYLDAWLEDARDDATGIARALGDIARAQSRDAGFQTDSLRHALGNPPAQEKAS